MSEFWQKLSKSRHFDKLLLTVLFFFTVGLCVYLIKKNDAGGDDMAFIVWAETQAAVIIGGLIGLIKGEAPAAHVDQTPGTTTTTTTSAMPEGLPKG